MAAEGVGHLLWVGTKVSVTHRSEGEVEVDEASSVEEVVTMAEETVAARLAHATGRWRLAFRAMGRKTKIDGH